MNKPQKIQLRLTIQSTAFFIIIAGLIYFYFSQKFEEQVLDKFKFKSEIMTSFLETNPQVFEDSQIEDKTQLMQLMMLNDVSYLVIEDSKGNLVDAVNLDIAEYYLYASADDTDNLSLDESVYKVVLPVTFNEHTVGKVYLGLKAGMAATELKGKKLSTALFSLSILLAGIIFTYFQYRFIKLILPN